MSKRDSRSWMQAQQGLTRRTLLQRSAGAAMAVPAIAASSPAWLDGGRAAAQIDPSVLVIADNTKGYWITLDPARIYEVNSQAGAQVVYETLYWLPDSNKPTEFEPLLATDFPETSADGLELTIPLRTGVLFHHSGNEMTADDWVFSWLRLAGMGNNPSFLYTEYIESVEAVDPSTLKVKLLSPNAAIVPILSAAPMSVTDSKVVMENGGVTELAEGESDPVQEFMINTSAGTGPFQIVQFDIDTEIILERHADYWGEAPALEQIIWRNIEDPNSQVQAVQVGEADIAFSVDPDMVEAVEADTNLQMLTGPTLDLGYLALHTQEDPGGPVAVKEVRQAIGYAIDYEGILTGLAGGRATRPATVIPDGLLSTEEMQGKGYSLDLTRAQELFDASGVGEVTITLTYNANAASSSGMAMETLAAKLQNDIQQISGLTVELEPMDDATRLQAYREGRLQFTYSGWAPDYTDVHTYADPFGRTDGAAARRVGYSNPEVDALLDQGIAETDVEARKQIYVEIQEKIIDDAPFLSIDQPVAMRPAAANVQGVQVHSVYMFQLRSASKA